MEVPIFRILSIYHYKILKRARLVRLPSCLFVVYILYSEKSTSTFSVKTTYTPPFAYLKLRKL